MTRQSNPPECRPASPTSVTRPADPVTVGLISDTHGLLRAEALEALRGSDLIVHAGDVGDRTIIERLVAIAPTTVVRGNIDAGAHAGAWPETAELDIGGIRLYVVHDVGTLNLDPVTAGYSAVIYGHSHKPLIETRSGVLFINPGSAGPRRFRLPISVGVLHLDGGAMSARIINLNP
jgi:uncharacterized protein